MPLLRAASLASRPLRVRLRRTRTRWLLTVCVAMVALGWTVSTVVSAQNAVEEWGRRQTVPVATVDLEPGQVVSAEEVMFVARPVAVLPDDVADSPIGRTITRPIARGETMIERRFAGGRVTGPAALLDQNTIGFTIPIDAGTPLLNVGDSVALFAPSDGPTSTSRGQGPAVRLTREAIVISISEKAVMVAVPSSEAGGVAQALLSTSLVLGLTN